MARGACDKKTSIRLREMASASVFVTPGVCIAVNQKLNLAAQNTKQRRRLIRTLSLQYN